GSEPDEEGPRLLGRGRGRRPAQHRHVGARRQRARRGLVAEQRQRLRPGADEDDAVVGAPPGEPGLLAQEAVAGLHGVAPRVPRHGEQLIGVEIGPRPVTPEGAGGVHPVDVEGRLVVLREDADGTDSELGGGARDPDRHLPAIRDQETGYPAHGGSLPSASGARTSTGEPGQFVDRTGRSEQRTRPMQTPIANGARAARHHFRFHAPHAHLSSPFGDDWFGRHAEDFARFFGTPTFLVVQTVIVGIWIALNVTGLTHFDVYPFILLNLAFSLQAAYAA